MKRVILHLGAHKTATTFLQKQMLAHSNNHTDLDVIPISYLRKGFTNHVRNGIPFKKDSFDPKSRLINTNIIRLISDENLLTSPALLKKGKLYLNLDEKLKRLKLILGENSHYSIFFSIRNYKSYLTSMYCEYLRHNNFCTFSNYLENFEIEKSNWTNVYMKLSRFFGKENVTILNFDCFEPLETLKVILPNEHDVKIVKLPDSNAQVRATLPHKLINILQFVSTEVNPLLAKNILTLLEKNNIGMEGLEKFSPDLSEISKELDLQYKKDLSFIFKR